MTDKIEQVAQVLFEDDAHPMLERVYQDMDIDLTWQTLNKRNKDRYRDKARKTVRKLGYTEEE